MAFPGPSTTSSVYETEAWGKTDQPAFLNAAIILHSQRSIEASFHILRRIESGLGGQKSSFWGPREIDIDLIFFGQEIYHAQDLSVPHPRAHLRNFVLAPLSELIPYYRHPQLKRSLEELYLSSKDPLRVRQTSLSL
jgi:2-amino-4-hydroxy-6-hydroxymethyldihydropteridine diphosphokinase